MPVRTRIGEPMTICWLNRAANGPPSEFATASTFRASGSSVRLCPDRKNRTRSRGVPHAAASGRLAEAPGSCGATAPAFSTPPCAAEGEAAKAQTAQHSAARGATRHRPKPLGPRTERRCIDKRKVCMRQFLQNFAVRHRLFELSNRCVDATSAPRGPAKKPWRDKFHRLVLSVIPAPMWVMDGFSKPVPWRKMMLGCKPKE